MQNVIAKPVDPSHSQCSVNYTFSQTWYLQLSYTASQYKSVLFAKQGSAEHSNDDWTQIKWVGVVKYGLQTQDSFFFLPHAAVISLFSFPCSSPSVFCSPCSPFALDSRVQATLHFAPIKTSPSPPPPKLCMASSLAFSTRVIHRRTLAEGQSVLALGSLSLQLK